MDAHVDSRSLESHSILATGWSSEICSILESCPITSRRCDPIAPVAREVGGSRGPPPAGRLVPTMSRAKILILRYSHPPERASPLPLPPDVEADVATHEQLLAGRLGRRVSDVDALLLDARTYPERDAAALVASDIGAIRATDASRPVLVIADDEAAPAAAAAAAGAIDVLYSLELAEELARRCLQALRLGRLRRTAGADAAAAGLRQPEESPLQMVGSSHGIRDVFSQIRRSAPFGVPVLLIGEPGTGKHLTGLAIHDRSPRAEGPFVTSDCGALPPTLLDAQLFGSAPPCRCGGGAAAGQIEAAAEGTLYLDEIEELPVPLQQKLVAVLTEGMSERAGGRERVPADVRILAATPRDLAPAVRQGRFREDLFELLRVLTIRLPALRERGDDVLLIARYFLTRYAAIRPTPLRGFTKTADEAMLAHDWPGNVRELEHRVRNAALVSDRARIRAEDLELVPSGPTGRVQTLYAARRQAEARCVRAALQQARGDLAEAARLLGISRRELARLRGRDPLPPQRPHSHA